jgi:hypothetical protein
MTYKHPGTKVKTYSLPALFLLLVSLSLLTMNCADDPTSLGLKFLPSNETTGVVIFDSYLDSMAMTSKNFKYRVNSYFSQNLIVGQNANYNSKALIKFSGIPGDKDSAVVNSAYLVLKYKNYFFPNTLADSLGQISFNIYKVNQNINYQRITLDSVTASTFGTVSQGSYTGTPTSDTQEVDISLNTTLVKDWFEYAADPENYPVKNYGIVLAPNASSNVLKAFYSAQTGAAVKPAIVVIYTKYGDTDTLYHDISETMFLADVNLTPLPERFYLHAGISYDQIMRFDMSNIPAGATINDAQIILTLDSANSIFTRITNKGLAAAFVTDSAAIKTESFVFDGVAAGNQISFRIITPFQRWLNNASNQGIMIIPGAQTSNLDVFSIYDINASDPNKRPRVIIKYTPRITP